MGSVNPYMASTADSGWEAERAPTWGDRSIVWLLFSFRGRIPRLAYWTSSLFVAMVYYGGLYLGKQLLGAETPAFAALALCIVIPMFWATLAISVKRWHDRNKSGWWFLINFIPLIGGLWALVENGFLSGTPGQNYYGD